ncbi:lipopolysaccharide biosynthesis protein [Mycobacterium sp. MBM]|nr:lipopolysaccharide biosynthesis protein [Mycobacterium sp. MBM]
MDSKEVPPQNLGRSAARGASVTAVGMVIRILAQAVGLVVLARILSPTDFGLVAMVVAVVSVGDILRDFGLSYAAVQAPTFSLKQRSNLFWLNTVFGAAMGAAVFGLAWPIADLYNDQRLVAITQVLAITFLVNGIGSQYRASLQRSLAFSALALAETAGQIISVSAGIIAAMNGLSYWSIVIQFVVHPIVVVAILVATSRWIPRGFYRHQDTRHFLTFGWRVMAVQTLNYASANVDTVAVGLKFGPAALGYYSRAYQLMAVPVIQLANGMIRVSVPVLAKIQAEAPRFNHYLIRAQTALLAFMLFILVALASLTEPIVMIVLGHDWLESVPILRILAVAGIFQTLTYPIDWAFMALGLTRAQLVQAVISRPLLIISVIVGAQFTVEGVAWGYAVGAALGWPIALFTLARTSSVRVTQLIAVASRMVLVNAYAGICVSLINEFRPLGNALGAVILGLGSMLAFIALAIWLAPPIRSDYIVVGQIFKLLSNKINRRHLS